ncbi:MAG: hypothetical protein E4H38_07635, partial [Gemmatimonadales bacterium]
MSRRMKLGLMGGLVVVIVGAVIAMGAAKNKNKPVDVRMETVGARDLVAVVSASGRIEPDTKVDVLSDIQGRITHIAMRSKAGASADPISKATRSITSHMRLNTSDRAFPAFASF